jgi:DNA-binding MarR family transcriptional regulator
MEEHVGLLIAIARRRLEKLAVARAAQHQLSMPQFWFLVAVAEHPGASQAELCAWLHHDAPTVSRLVTALSGQGLVRTEADPRDRRRTRLALTADGAQLAAGLAPSAREIREAATEGMSAPDVERLRRGLRRVIANVEDRLALEAGSPGSTGGLTTAAPGRRGGASERRGALRFVAARGGGAAARQTEVRRRNGHAAIARRGERTGR